MPLLIDGEEWFTTGEIIGPELRRWRERFGLTQQIIANRSGIHRPIVARLESPRHTPKLDSIYRYAAAVGISPRFILAVLDGYEIHPQQDLWRYRVEAQQPEEDEHA